MDFIYCDDYESLSSQAASLVVSAIDAKRNLLLCAATGRSPKGLYRRLADKAGDDGSFFAELRVLKLDEWCGLSDSDPGSCEHYLRNRVLGPLGISSDRYTAFASTAPEPRDECVRIRSELAERGPIDLCVLGLGVNGHIGFNEPRSSLKPHCHVAQLSAESRGHAMVEGADQKPRFGLTLGMQDILASRRIVLLIAGEGKQQAFDGLLAEEVSTTLPASFLWLHENVDCLVDRSAVIDRRDRAAT